MSDSGEFRPRRESRFAVVMYGGVSLAIYINGVAQELFNLVLSTAEGTEPDFLPGSAKVYREIGIDLNTRFVVDVLSGTSAGGINAVFLGKALANSQDMTELESLWVEEGDIQKLINDRGSAGGLKTRAGKGSHASPASLLNGGRMYEKLLDAFNAMKPLPENMLPRTGTPLVDKLDLFVTATDLEGLPIQIRLADRLVMERDHQHVFHFQMRDPNSEHDFKKENNGVLAFAARATSSFPLAFEPARVGEFQGKSEDWSPFFRRYPGIEAGKGTEAVADRSFADGGYLDNKPFSYAIDSIMDRTDDGPLPVDRKLIYIEPTPEEFSGPGKPKGAESPPDAFANAVKAFTLARYETIREDVDLLLARNELIERVARILKGTDEDLWTLPPKAQPLEVGDWFDLHLGQMIRKQGIAYGGYLRLRVARLTDDLAEFIGIRAGFDPNSDAFLAIRQLVRVWRDARYDYWEREDDGKDGFHRLILTYDFGFHLRRMKYLYNAMDRLLMDEEERIRVLKGQGLCIRVAADGAFTAELRRCRDVAREARNRILEIRRSVRTTTSLPSDILPFKEIELVRRLLGPTSDTRRRAEAEKLLAAWQSDSEDPAIDPAIDPVTEALKPLARGVEDALGHIQDVKTSLGLLYEDGKKRRWARKPKANPEKTARWLAAFCFRMFPHYDLVSFPILQTPGLGEEIDNVEIIRISPDHPDRLGGSRLAHFGGFFDKVWREADILQGRLDGAKSIIHALLPEPKTGEADAAFESRRNALVKDAQSAIMKEVGEGSSQRMDLLTSMVLGNTPATRSWAQRLLGTTDHGRVIDKLTKHEEFKALVAGTSSGEDLLDLFRKYQVEEQMEPALVVRSLSRSVRVAGRMFSGIAEKNGSGSGKRIASWIATVGGVATGLAEVLLPGSWPHLLIRRPFELLAAFSLVLIVLSAVLDVRGTGTLGAFLLATAVAFVLIGQRLERAVRVGRFDFGSLQFLFLVLVLALAFLGAIHLPETIESAIGMLRGDTAGPAG